MQYLHRGKIHHLMALLQMVVDMVYITTKLVETVEVVEEVVTIMQVVHQIHILQQLE